MSAKNHPDRVSEFKWQALSVMPCVPACAGQLEIDREILFPYECFNNFDLWLALEGSAVVDVLGQARPFDAGTVYLIPPGVKSRLRIANGTVFRHAFFHFEVRLCSRVIRDARRYVKANPLSLELPGIPTLGLFTPLETVRLAHHLLQTARRNDDVAQIQTQSLLLGVLGDIRREWLRRPTERNRRISFIDAALQYLEDNMQHPVFVADVARELNISVSHLTRIFRSQLNESPMQVLTRIRLARACEMLRNPKWNIGEVALACGFESFSFFTHVFSQHHNCPPSAYRLRFLPQRNLDSISGLGRLPQFN